MRTQVAFRSERFVEPLENGNSVNPHIFGAKLAAFLADEFKARGYLGNVIEEDFGWLIELASDPFDLCLGCASYDEMPDWIVFIKPNTPFVRKWFKKISTEAEVERVASILDELLRGPGEATDLDWQV